MCPNNRLVFTLVSSRGLSLLTRFQYAKASEVWVSRESSVVGSCMMSASYLQSPPFDWSF